MISKYYNILILVLIIGTALYTGLVTKITTFVTDFNRMVVVFIPEELFVLLLMIVFVMLIKIYQSIKSD